MQIQSVNNHNRTSFRGTLKSNEVLKKVETYVADKYSHPMDKELFNGALDYIKNKTPKSDVFELRLKSEFYGDKPDTAVVYRNNKPAAEWWIDTTTYGDTIGQEERGCIGALCELVGNLRKANK